MIERIYRVLRGGSWSFSPYSRRTSCRFGLDAAARYGHVGFRLVVKIKEKE